MMSLSKERKERRLQSYDGMTDRIPPHSCICCADALCPAPCNAGIYACRAIRGFPKGVSCP